MKVKMFDASSSKRLEKKVNDFLAQPEIKVAKVDLSAAFGSVIAMVAYEGTPSSEWEE